MKTSKREAPEAVVLYGNGDVAAVVPVTETMSLGFVNRVMRSWIKDDRDACFIVGADDKRYIRFAQRIPNLRRGGIGILRGHARNLSKWVRATFDTPTMIAPMNFKWCGRLNLD